MYITVNDQSDQSHIFVTVVAPVPASSADNRREERRLAIVEAAESLFLERGYERTSLAAIIERSGGSLATVYELFGNKQGLLHAVVERQSGPDLCRMEEGTDGGESTAVLLMRYAHQLYEHMMMPHVIALMRVIIVESMRDPDFSRAFHRDFHVPVVQEMAEIFARWTREGRADIDRPEAAAELFWATIISDAQLRAMTAIAPPPLIEAGLDWRLAPFLGHFRFR